MIKNKKYKSGFTVLETLLALSILILAITATFSAAQSGLAISISSKDQVLAFHFAQEAVETIRNIRDENGIQDFNWLEGITQDVSDPCYFGNFCAIDSPAKTITRCGNDHESCPLLRQDRSVSSGTYGMYGIDNATWSQTSFRRSIFLEEINDDEISLSVRVTWSKGMITRSFVVKENLLNWQR